MNLYLDCEFNGHGGQLLSLALANPTKTGKHFYGRLGDPPKWHPWVKENVVPHFGIEPESKIMFRNRLRVFLQAREGCTIYADWPADFMYLMDVMCGEAFEDSWTAPCVMVLLRESDPKPEVSHNALSDAVALMKWHEGIEERGEYDRSVVTYSPIPRRAAAGASPVDALRNN